MPSPDYYVNHNGPAKIPISEEIYHLLCFLDTVLLMLPLLLHFKEHVDIFQILSQIFEHFHHIRTYTAHTPPVVNSNCALSEFIAGENTCSKFINQDLTFLQPPEIPSTFWNVVHNDNLSVQVSQS